VVSTLRIFDADILAYALYDGSPAHEASWGHLRGLIEGGLSVSVTPATILETYNALFWFYRVRPMKSLLEKLGLLLEAFKVVESPLSGFKISLAENIPLGDGFLVASALQHKIPVVVSNDRHVLGCVGKYGLIGENPVPEEVRSSLSEWSNPY
jgi:predicted nucleic acid-binding protein